MRTECTVCSHSSANPHYAGLLICSNCGHVFADLNLSYEELCNLYSKKYFFGEEYSDYLRDKDTLQKNFRLRLKTLKKYVSANRHKRLFEVGCAYGFFLDIARDDFHTVSGIDISSEGVGYACNSLGLDALPGNLLETDLGKQKFDVVCFWDTIEHLHRPDLFIEKISNHMDAGALLAITTGDIGSLNARLKKDSWRLIHPPTHLHYFSGKTLSRLLNRFGFSIVYHRHCGFYRSMDQIAYNILVLREKAPFLYNILKQSKVTNLSFYLNLYDIMYVIAEKDGKGTKYKE
jgi:predicted TPR repeat methyltransferase